MAPQKAGCPSRVQTMHVQLGALSGPSSANAAKLNSMDFCTPAFLTGTHWQERSISPSLFPWGLDGDWRRMTKAWRSDTPVKERHRCNLKWKEPQGVQPSLTTLVPELFGPGGLLPSVHCLLSFPLFPQTGSHIRLFSLASISPFFPWTQRGEREGAICSAIWPHRIFHLVSFAPSRSIRSPVYRHPIFPCLQSIRILDLPLLPPLGDFTIALTLPLAHCKFVNSNRTSSQIIPT